MNEGFLTDLRTAQMFFRFCKLYRVQEKKERVAVMREIVRRKKAKYIRDVQTFTQGKRVGALGTNQTIIAESEGTGAN